MSERENGLSLVRLQAVNILAGASGSDVSDCDPETVAEWLRDDSEFIAGLNRAKLVRRERLRADIRSLASDAIATLRGLITDRHIHVPPAVRLRACIAVLQAADAMNVEEIGPTSAEAVQAKLEHNRFIESLGG